jgi:uncharacterized FlaG/YvyC family protein
MINIDKVDPRIVKFVLESTAKNYVHKKDQPFVDKDGRHKKRESKWNIDDLKKEIGRLNDLFVSEGVDIFLVAFESVDGMGLKIKVFERSSKELIRILNEDSMDRILKKIMGDSGIIFDQMV